MTYTGDARHEPAGLGTVDFLGFLVAAVMTLGPLAATALFAH
ncbi:hypothetical protein [Reyranella sp.]